MKQGVYLIAPQSVYLASLRHLVFNSLQCAGLLIHDVILIKPISRQGSDQCGC